jgi:4-hydroxy-tetrahydrodipicolinate synthase
MTDKQGQPRFSGAMTALVTPMRDGAVDHAGLRELVEFQISEGIDGLVPCGTTGEAATLSAEERVAVFKTVVEQTGGRVPVIAGVGANCTRTAVANGKLAEEAGVDGLLHVTPFYNKPPPAGLVAHFTAVAEATALPIVAYNVPGRTSCDMQAETVAQIAKLPNLVGIKEATGSIARGQQVITACPPDFGVLSGDDATAFALTAAGGCGVISVVSNVAPGPTAKMIAHARAGELAAARALHYELLPLMDLLFISANPIPVKAALSLMGYTANELRLPLVPLEQEGIELLRAELKRLGRLS